MNTAFFGMPARYTNIHAPLQAIVRENAE